jgi:hypothetical protein
VGAAFSHAKAEPHVIPGNVDSRIGRSEKGTLVLSELAAGKDGHGRKHGSVKNLACILYGKVERSVNQTSDKHLRKEPF